MSGSEVAIEQVRCNRQVVFAVRGHNVFAFASGSDAVIFHQSLYPALSRMHAVGKQGLPDAQPAIFASCDSMGSLDVNQQCFVTEALASRY